MPITVIPEAQPAFDGLGDKEAQTTPADLRLGLNLSQIKSGFIYMAIGVSVSTCASLATVGLIAASFMNGQAATVLFTAVTVTTAWLMTAFSLATANTLLRLYRNTISRADEAIRQNAILRRRNLRLVTERRLREEGEAGDGVGDAFTSPASLRFIPHKGSVN